MKNLKYLLIIVGLIFLGCTKTPKVKTPDTKQVSKKYKLTKNSILKLDTGGHSSLIKDILVTSDKSEFITASRDKSIRIWDSKTGKLKRKILGKIGKGKIGSIFSIALRGDDKYLAVGGMLDKNIENGSAIRIYDYKSGKLVKLLKSHKNVVLDLAFSKDGKYLVSGSGDTKVKIWDREFKLIYTFSQHEKIINAVDIIKTKDDYLIISTSKEKVIHLFSLKKQKLIKSFKSDFILKYIASNEDEIVLCGNGDEILIFDTSLNLIKKIKTKTQPSGLAYSPSGKYLVCGFGTSPAYVTVYDASSNYKKLSTFEKHSNTTVAVNFLDENRVLSGGGDNFEIYLWNRDDGEVIKKIEGEGRRMWSVGISGDKIAYGTKFQYVSHNEKAKLEKSFDLKKLKFVDETKEFKIISNANENYYILHDFGGNYGYNDGVLKIYKNNDHLVAMITKNATDGYRHITYGFYKGKIISGGSNGVIKVYNIEGKEIASLVGHSGDILSIALDGDTLVSGSSDQTIKLWNLKKINTFVPKIDDKLLQQQILSAKKQTGRTWSKKEMMEFWDRRFKSHKYMKQLKISPKLTIFIAKDEQWIAWRENGNYISSQNGAKYLGFHINYKTNKESVFAPINSFKKFQRTKIIK